jgi:hypothetical protein
MKTTAEKRELLRRVREAVHLSNAVVRDVALQDAADFIESTLPKQKSPGQRMWESLAERRGWLPWDKADGFREDYEAAAAELNIQPQDIE